MAASRGCKQALGAFVRPQQPIPFDAPDGRPVAQVFVLLVPEHATEEHLQLLSELAQMFSDKAFREQLAAGNEPVRAARAVFEWVRRGVMSAKGAALERECPGAPAARTAPYERDGTAAGRCIRSAQREYACSLGRSAMSDGGAMRQVSVERLFEDNHDRLGLTWLAGRQGGNRVLSGEAALKPTIGQVGHMNFIHPFRVQLIGAAEASYLRGLPEDALRASIERLFTTELVAIVVANGEEIPTHLLDECNRHHIALVTSPQPSPHVVDVMRLYLSRVLAESTTLHGVFLDVLEMGVLITGASAIGKSELALELISRGNGLVADDIVELYRISPDTLEGRCPAVLKDFLEVRGIGVLNIRTIFGETAVRPRKLLKLMVHLEDHGNEQFSELDRLQVSATYQEILGVPIRKVTIPVAAGRNLAVLVEAAVRNFVLNQRGIDSTKEFIERQQKLMEDGG